MVGTMPQAFEETALITIQRLGGTAYLFGAITETIDISTPDYPGESIANIAGGRIWKQSPQEDGEITLEIYPVDNVTTTGTGLFQQYNSIPSMTWDTSQPVEDVTAFGVGVDRTRDRFMVVIMWTDDTTITTAALVNDPSPSTTSNKVALRFYAKECRITSHKSSFTDGILKTTVTFKFPAMNKAGDTRTFQWGSTDDLGTTPLAALTYSAAL